MKGICSLFLLALVCVVSAQLPVINVKNSKLFVNNKEFTVKGVNYSPAPIGQESMSGDGYGGTGLCSAKLTPWDEWKSACYDSDYYDGSTDINPARFPQGMKPLWDRDFPNMKALGVNTIRLYNTNPSTRAATQQYTNLFDYATGKDHTQFVKYCADNGLMVIYPLFTDNNAYANTDEYTFKRYLRWQIDEVGNYSSILMWQFGNEMNWLWYGTSTWNDPTATAKFNGYLAYIRRYTLSKWGRFIPITCAIPNFSEQYNYQYQNWHVDVFSANVFFNNYDYLFEGDGAGSDFLGITTLSCIYNKPFLMTEIGPTWAPGTPYTPGALNEIWFNVIKNMPYGLIGAIWFELTDEPALGKDFGLFSFQTSEVNGQSSTDLDAFIADTIVQKQQWWDAISGNYNGAPYNFPTDMYQLMGRSPTYFNNVTDRCAGQGLYSCPGSSYPKCSGNGICDRTVGTCTCAPGWSGTTCSTATCPKAANGYTCNGKGSCSTLVTPPECACTYGYYGAACDTLTSSVPKGSCPNGCSEGSGVCNQTVRGDWLCMCHQGWTGPDCSIHDVGVGNLNVLQNYIGCLKQPNFTVTAPPSTTQTNQKCAYYCAMRNYKYAGTTAGNTCMCGNQYASSSTSTCYNLCGGDYKQLCGGPTTVSTYVSGYAAGAGYLGCYPDDSTRDLPIMVSENTAMTIDSCRKSCAGMGYVYAGLQDGSQCFCGNSFGNKGAIVADSNCADPCWGDTSFMCGGAWMNSIYTAALPVGYSYA